MLKSNDLINRVKAYNKFLNPETLSKAYDFALKAHANQKRISGDPYLIHPVAVANILTELKLDSATIATGLLHDTIEDTKASYETIKDEKINSFEKKYNEIKRSYKDCKTVTRVSGLKVYETQSEKKFHDFWSNFGHIYSFLQGIRI